MRVKIKNFAKIKEADILADGITVIAGENNTGKSTVGKILFAFFNVLCGIEDKITQQRIREIEKSGRMLLKNYFMGETYKSSPIRLNVSASRRIAFTLGDILEEKGRPALADIQGIIEKTLGRYAAEQEVQNKWETINDLSNKIEEILNLSEDAIMLEIISRYFEEVFHGQINSLVGPDTEAEINIEIKDKKIRMIFNQNKCISYEAETAILHNAIYIDNPFIIDKLEDAAAASVMEEYLKSLLTKNSEDGIMDNIIGSVLAKEKMGEIFRALNSVIDGQIVMQANDEFYLKKEGFTKPISLSNLSTGLKSFVILKILIEKGLVKDKDVLILDEPEIHLHPEWQQLYAELIALLQKTFDLSVIVTTHSPLFLESIEYFTHKYSICSECGYYKAIMVEGQVFFEDHTNSVDQIYSQMVAPSIRLDQLKYEMVDENE